MNEHYGAEALRWQRNLETVGTVIFQRYRKRLLEPWIAVEIRRDFPGLSWPDLLVRVAAGRQLIADGDDFRALRAIRSGEWAARQQAQVSDGGAPASSDARRDRVSRLLVRAGGLLFSLFCLLSLLAGLRTGVSGLLGLALCGALLVAWLARRSRAQPAARSRSGQPSNAGWVMRSADAGLDSPGGA